MPPLSRHCRVVSSRVCSRVNSTLLAAGYPTWITSSAALPRSEGAHSRRNRGRGRVFSGLSTPHDSVAAELIIHLAWPSLSAISRSAVCEASSVFSAYAKLRQFAASKPIEHWDHLHSMDSISMADPNLSHKRAYGLAASLLLLDFNVGDLIRWLGGAYTHEHIPMGPIRTAISAIRSIPSPEGYLS